jgi:ribonuclease Z
MTFNVTILGSNSAVPAHGRHPSAQVINVHDQLYLVDCGEGTQMLFHQHQIKWNRIRQIFISHLHGDHYFGLVGLISTYHLLQRNKPLDIFGPQGLEEIIRLQLDAGHTQLCYPLQFHVIDTTISTVIFEDKGVEVSSIPLNHRIPCAGFLFREKFDGKKVDKEKLATLRLPLHIIPHIKRGEDIVDPHTGETIPNDELTIPHPARRSYAYCSDTAYSETVIQCVQGVDLLYHDCTFDKAGEERAAATFHGTTEHAAKVAAAADAGQLIIGHFSARFENLDPLLEEARAVFPATELALEGCVFDVGVTASQSA